MEIDSGKESTIELLGAAGFFITADAIIQAFMMMRFAWLLLVSGILLFFLQVLFLLSGGILWLSVVLCLYTLVVVVLFYIQE